MIVLVAIILLAQVLRLWANGSRLAMRRLFLDFISDRRNIAEIQLGIFMKSDFFLLVLFAASAAGGGYWLGQRNAHPVGAAPVANQISPSAAVAQPSGALS